MIREMKQFGLARSRKIMNDLPVIAAIDLGTNSCRLLIARVKGANYKVIDSFSRVTRLGEGIHKTNVLAQSAIERAVKALAVCRSKIDSNRVTHLRAVTTEACRRAENSGLFLDRVSQEFRLNLEIITSQEEARLALSGCSGILNPELPYALAFDIGGGSTEIMWLKIFPQEKSLWKKGSDLPDYEVIDCFSLPYGVVTLSEIYGSKFNDPSVYEVVRQEIGQKVSEFSVKNGISDFIADSQVQMIGTSGTVTTLAAIDQNLARYERRIIDGAFLTTEAIHRISSHVLRMPHSERVQHPCIGMGRADLVLTGAAILEGICDMWPLSFLRVADRGVREGILIDLVRGLQLKGKKNEETTVRS